MYSTMMLDYNWFWVVVHDLAVAVLFSCLVVFWLKKTLVLSPISQVDREPETLKDRLKAHFANPWRKSYILDYVLLSFAGFSMQVAHSAEGYAKVEASYLEDCEYGREISIAL